MKKSIYLFLLLILSCEYSPTTSHFVELTKSEPPEAILQSVQLFDNVKIFGQVSFKGKLEINLKATKLKEVTFIVTNSLNGNTNIYYPQVSYSSSSDSFYVSINSYELNNGNNYLKLLIKTSIGSGSLSDKRGLEGYQLSKSWVFNVQNYPAVPVNVSSIEVDEGRLKINWTKYPNLNFKKYSIWASWSQYDPQNVQNLDYVKIAELNDIDSTACYLNDTDFPPFGFFIFQIRTEAFANYSITEAKGAFRKFEVKTPQLFVERISYDNFKISWNKPLLYPLFKSYKISLNYNENAWKDLNFNNINDTTYSYKDFTFGFDPKFYFLINNVNLSYNGLSQQKYSFPDTTITIADYRTDKILLLMNIKNNNDQVFAIMNKSDQAISKTFAVSGSYDFLFKYWQNDTICAIDGSKILFYNSNNGALIKSIELGTLYPYPMKIVGSSISKTGYICLMPGKIIGTNSYQVDTYDEVNYNTKVKIKSEPALTSYPTVISKAGKYIIKAGKFYSANSYFSNGNYLYQKTLGFSPTDFYNEDENYFIHSSDYYTLSVFNSSNGTMLAKINTKVIAFDYSNGNYLTIVNGYLEFRNLSGNLISKVKCNTDINEAILIGNQVLYGGSGNYYSWKFN